MIDATSQESISAEPLRRASKVQSQGILHSILQFWENRRLILSIFAGSLIVIAALVQLLFLYQQKLTEENTRRVGQNLAMLIAEIPYDNFDENINRNLFKKIYESQVDTSLAYISLVDLDGKPIYEVAASGIQIPDAVTYQEPARWYGEHAVGINESQEAREFFAPWLVSTEIYGFIRLAYITPQHYLGWKEAYLVGLVTCFAFLQTLLVYAFVLREAGKHQANLKGAVAATGSAGGLSGLLTSLTNYVLSAKLRIARLEDEHAGLITASSIATYQCKKAEAILNTIPECILMIDDTGTITFANRQIAALFNTQQQNIQQEPIQSWCSVEPFRQYIHRILHPALSAKSPSEFTMGVGGDKKTFLATSHPIFISGSDNDATGVLVLVRDNTQQSMDENNREEYVAHICHELKTPLNTLSMYSETLLDEDNVTEEFRLEAINIIYDETHRMKDLINNLLNLAKIEMGSMSVNRQRVKLHDFLLDIYKNITSVAANSGITFKLDIPNGLDDIVVDKTLYRIVITNLLTNAIKYNRPNGEVVLKAEESDTSVTISVCDTGIGISEEDCKNIFEKFFRSTEDSVRQISGHGLGLALARDIVHMNNGTLKVKSEVGKGSEFVLEITRDPELLMKVG